MTTDQLWPHYAGPADLPDIESVPLHRRGLPNSTFEIVERAASLWPHAPAVTVLPDATHWGDGTSKTFGELATDVRRYANFLRDIGIRRDSVVALLSPNCDGLIAATLAAQLAGIAAPINSGLSATQVGELLERSGARTLISASPEFDAASWDVAKALADAGSVDCILLLSPTGTAVTEPVPTVPGVTVGHLTDMASGYDGAVFEGDPPGPGDLAAIFHTGAPPEPRNSRRTPTPMRSPTPGWWPPPTPSSTRIPWSSRRYPVPRQRTGGHPAGPAAARAASGVGRSAGIPRSGAVCELLEDRAAVSDRSDERGAHRLCGARSVPD